MQEPQFVPAFSVVPDLSGQPGGLLLDAQRRKTSADSVILQRHRRTEQRHDPVAGELVHRAAITLHYRRSAVDQVGHDLAQSLRPDGRGDVPTWLNVAFRRASLPPW